MIYSDEQFEQLEQEERAITDEAIAAMIAILAATKSDLERELRDFYSKYGKDGVVTYAEARKWASESDHRRRLTILLLFINENFKALLSDLTPEFKAMLEEVIGKEAEFFNEEVEDDATTTVWGVDEKTWLERLTDDAALWAAYIATDIKQAFLKRKHIDDVLKQLDKRFVSIGHIIEKLGLTESTAVGSLGRRSIFKKLGVSKYRFYTRADERTCETCGAMHGLVFPISAFEVGVTASPLHPRCRCWEVPIID